VVAVVALTMARSMTIKKIVAAHAGKLKYVNIIGGGVTFRIFIPTKF
jgi:hypothetical protein